MKLFQKLLVLLTVFALVLCCAACGTEPTYTTEDKDSTSGGTGSNDSIEITTVYTDKTYGFQMEKPAAGDTVAIMHTSMGDIYIRLFPEAAPKAVENFTTHAKNGYYNGLTFHRVMEDFMIQGGDPKGDGTGGESCWGGTFEDEFDQKLLNIYGALSMANSGVDTNGSQFFINQAGPTGDTAEELKNRYGYDYEALLSQYESQYEQYVKAYGADFTAQYPDKETFAKAAVIYIPDEAWELYAEVGGNIHLDNVHTVFGHVYQGMDVVDAIAAVETDEDDKPVEDVTITSIEITTYTG